MGSLSMGFGALHYPAGALAQPAEVVRNPSLTLNEQRVILASWAADACAVEAAPALRRVPGGPIVTIDDVMGALRLLDREAGQLGERPSYRHAPEHRRGRCRRIFGTASRRRLGSSVN
jgi:hypothetical protein